MRITEKTWIEYITRLAKINETAGQKNGRLHRPPRHAGYGRTDCLCAAAGAENTAREAQNLPRQMYDAMAEASGADVPPAVPAEPADYNETAKW